MNWTREEISKFSNIKDCYEEDFINLLREFLQSIELYRFDDSDYDYSQLTDNDKEERKQDDLCDEYMYIRYRFYDETSYETKLSIVNQFGLSKAYKRYIREYEMNPPEDKFIHHLFAHCVFDWTLNQEEIIKHFL